MRIKRKIIGFDCSGITFCCGPCESTVEENPERIFLKPNNGGRYARFTWKTQDDTLIDLRNVRMCRPCCHRYMEIVDGVNDHDFESIERMQQDADCIIKKLNLS